MTNKLLLSNRYKKIGWFILIPAFIAGVILSITGYEANWLQSNVFAIVNNEFFGKTLYFQFVEINITNTAVGVLFLGGAMLVAFSKEKTEDEFIVNIRLTSLLWALLVNNILLLIAFVFIYGTTFFSVMVYNMFTVLIIFILRFNYLLYKNSKTVIDEK